MKSVCIEVKTYSGTCIVCGRPTDGYYCVTHEIERVRSDLKSKDSNWKQPSREWIEVMTLALEKLRPKPKTTPLDYEI